MSAKGKSNGGLSVAEIEERLNVLGRAVFGSESFGKVMNTTVSAGSRIQRRFNDQMGRGLHFYNIPTQDDVVDLAERCGRIEERVVHIEQMLMRLVEASAPAKKTGPARTKRPPSRTAAETSKAPTRTKKAAARKKSAIGKKAVPKNS